MKMPVLRKNLFLKRIGVRVVFIYGLIELTVSDMWEGVLI
jgi:hypothetical protein